jgi:hypothetical protein
MTRFWNNLHQVRSKLKDLKPKRLNVLEAIKPNGLYRIPKTGLRSPMPEEGEP